MVYVSLVAKRKKIPVEKAVPLRDIPRITWTAFPALMIRWSFSAALQRHHHATEPPRSPPCTRCWFRFPVSRGHLGRRLQIAGDQRAHNDIDRILIAAAMAFNLRHHGREHFPRRSVMCGVTTVARLPSSCSRT